MNTAITGDASYASENEYQEALQFLFSRLPMFSRIGAAAYKPGLERVVALSRHFGNPEKKLKAIHIAGTNGKGSTSHMIAAVLQAAGYKTALYTSPHLVDFRERIKINGDMIPKDNVVDFVKRWKDADYPGDAPSFFELTMMMAFDWFASENVDYAVIETGMGGRLDSTNILSPLLCVITNISPDHMQFLGNTLPEIAGEKAGIIKSGVPVVIGEAEGDVEKVCENKASETGAPLIKAYESQAATDFSLMEDYSGWKFMGRGIGEMSVDLAGDYQQKNVATALRAVELLRDCGVALSDSEIKRGFASAASSTGLAGRWMITGRDPLTICDTGHNIGGLSWNVGRLKELTTDGRKLRMVIGFVADKAIDSILSIFPKDAVYYVTNAQIPRALPAPALLEKCREYGLNARAFASVGKAMEAVGSEAGAGDVVYVGGSTFIVADYLAKS